MGYIPTNSMTHNAVGRWTMMYYSGISSLKMHLRPAQLSNVIHIQRARIYTLHLHSILLYYIQLQTRPRVYITSSTYPNNVNYVWQWFQYSSLIVCGYEKRASISLSLKPVEFFMGRRIKLKSHDAMPCGWCTLEYQLQIYSGKRQQHQKVLSALLE